MNGNGGDRNRFEGGFSVAELISEGLMQLEKLDIAGKLSDVGGRIRDAALFCLERAQTEYEIGPFQQQYPVQSNRILARRLIFGALLASVVVAATCDLRSNDSSISSFCSGFVSDVLKTKKKYEGGVPSSSYPTEGYRVSPLLPYESEE